MAAASRYWRVLFRTSAVYGGSSSNMGFEGIRLYTADGTQLTPNAVTSTAANENAGTYPLSNLTDGSPSTFWVVRFASSGVTSAVLQSITFDLGAGNAALVDRVDIQIGSATWPQPRIPENLFDFYIDSSSDGVTYARQSAHYRPLASTDFPYRLAATPSSATYPIPSRTDVGGTGGIYGIVSEDGVALPNRPVILYERETFAKVAWITTDENGGYGFNGLNTAREYMVFSYDPSGPPYKNALVWDRITPINTLTQLTPQSAFWARRARDASFGGLISPAEYIDGGTYNTMGANILAAHSRPALGDGLSLAPVSAVGGSLRFIKSARTAIFTAAGFGASPTAGTFSGNNVAADAGNSAALTFEYIFVAPGATETAMYVIWSGTRDSDDANIYNRNPYSTAFRAWGGGPTLEVLNTGVINVRFPLGARNRSTVRCTTTVTPGTMHHVTVTYAENSEIKLYLDGVLVQTTAVLGTGRLWGHAVTNDTALLAIENFDGSGARLYEAALRRLTWCIVAGPGNQVNNVAGSPSSAATEPGPGFGGAIGLAALYGRTFSAGDVAELYDSFVNWSSHTVLTTQSGYMGEVEADNPVFYARMNELSRPTRLESIVGARAYYGTYEATASLGATGFVGGSTAVNTASGGAILAGVEIPAQFSVELFIRPSSISGAQTLFLTRVTSGTACVQFFLSAGKPFLRLTDESGTDTTFALGADALVVGQSYHVVVTYDPFNAFLSACYINAVKVGESTATVFPKNSSDRLSIGGNVSGAGVMSERFQGDMAEFAIYNYALSAERVQAHYDARLI